MRRGWIDRPLPGQSLGLAVSRQCALAGVARSRVYAPRNEDVLDELDLELLRLIDAQCTRRPFYGTRRMLVYSREQGHTVNRKRVQRLMRVLVVGVIAGVLVIGRWLLQAALGYCASRRQMDAFGLVLFLAVLLAAWAVEHVGISMTLGAFLLGMPLSASALHHQIEATVAPFKQTLVGLFFIAVGMSIDVGALLVQWDTLLIQVPILLVLKLAVLGGLAVAFGISRSAAIRTGFYLAGHPSGRSPRAVQLPFLA